MQYVLLLSETSNVYFRNWYVEQQHAYYLMEGLPSPKSKKKGEGGVRVR
jgi:hypothetical protein